MPADSTLTVSVLETDLEAQVDVCRLTDSKRQSGLRAFEAALRNLHLVRTCLQRWKSVDAVAVALSG